MSETDGNTALNATMAGHLAARHIWIVACPNGSAESYANPPVSALTTCSLSLRLCAKGDPGLCARWQLSSLWQTTGTSAHMQNTEWEATVLISI